MYADIAILLNVVGYGKTHTLHQAMVRDESGQLKKLVQDYVTCTDWVERVALTEKIVYAWTGKDQVLAAETQKKSMCWTPLSAVAPFPQHRLTTTCSKYSFGEQQKRKPANYFQNKFIHQPIVRRM